MWVCLWTFAAAALIEASPTIGYYVNEIPLIFWEWVRLLECVDNETAAERVVTKDPSPPIIDTIKNNFQATTN